MGRHRDPGAARNRPGRAPQRVRCDHRAVRRRQVDPDEYPWMPRHAGRRALLVERPARVRDVRRQLARIRNSKIGFVFQTFALLPRLTALANVEMPLAYGGVRRTERRRAPRGARQRRPRGPRAAPATELSGGQRQRVAIARALVTNPRCCSRTSRPAISTAPPAPKYSLCSTDCTGPATPSCSSPTRAGSRAAPDEQFSCAMGWWSMTRECRGGPCRRVTSNGRGGRSRLSAILASCGDGGEPAPQYETAAVERGDLSRRRRGLGHDRAHQQRRSEIQGFGRDPRARGGDRRYGRGGSASVRIDPRTPRNHAAQAEAEVAAAAARLVTAKAQLARGEKLRAETGSTTPSTRRSNSQSPIRAPSKSRLALRSRMRASRSRTPKCGRQGVRAPS